MNYHFLIKTCLRFVISDLEHGKKLTFFKYLF